METITVVVPCYNEEEVLKSFYNEMIKVASEMKNVDFEILFIDDGSKDKTLSIIKNYSTVDSRVKYISFSRNFGKEAAIYAGLKAAIGEYVVIIDADLQHPPRLIKDMYYGIVKEGYDSVAAYRKDRTGESKIRSFFSRSFFKLASKITKLDFREGEEDYRMMNRMFVDAVLSIKEKNRFTKGIFQWVGFNVKWIEHENINRVAGNSKWSIFKLFTYSLDGIIGFSTVPLLISSFLGLILCLISTILGIYLIIKGISTNSVISSSLISVLVTLLISGVQLFLFGILGQYLGKTYLEIKERPLYIVKDQKILVNKEIEINEEFKIEA
ncbi:glycosyltransferase family 2 protein [Paraclostridium bifermentans]|uniref:glycosyltransferase family 2 protein n=1 Tax=Paraclostridium bifermentans TaxID=1490 RepID=UPI0018A082C4|nr:glycosyltransferase family 2 protein [Paraclostridium bifermentans]